MPSTATGGPKGGDPGASVAGAHATKAPGVVFLVNLQDYLEQ
jgi:hypothetical protein